MAGPIESVASANNSPLLDSAIPLLTELSTGYPLNRMAVLTALLWLWDLTLYVLWDYPLLHPRGVTPATARRHPPSQPTTTMNSKQFFKEVQGAAVIKHGVLRRYLRVFVSKVGSTARGGKVYYLDGFAGPGRYTDGTPGSPALAIQTADALAEIRDLQGICVEADAETFGELSDLLSDHPNWTAVNEPLEACLPRLLDTIGDDSPLFVFLDPFGLQAPFDLVADVLRRVQRGTGPTELLLNFSLPGFRRNAGHLTSDKEYPARSTFVARVDERLGGTWWQDIWRTEASDRERQVAEEYLRRLRLAGGVGWGWFMTPVSDRWEGPPSYLLMFLSRHRDGLWAFNESLSLAREDFMRFQGRGASDAQGQLFTEADEWVDEITRNIEHLLDNATSLTPQDNLGGVLGGALGMAREKHIRAAIKRLYEAGRVEPGPRGQDIPTLRLRRP